MTAVLLLIFAGAIAVVMSTRFTLVSLFIVSSCVYVLPAFWLPDLPAGVVLSWCLVFILAMLTKLPLRRVRAAPPRATAGANVWAPNNRFARITSLTFNYATLTLFALIIVRSGGVGIFFRGKYGGSIGDSLLLYYSWNSLLLITEIHNLYFRKFLSAWFILGLAQIFLIFVAGDRTIPVIFFSAVIYRYFHGAIPLSFPRRARVLMIILPFILPIAAVSKSIYTVLPHYGFTLKTVYLIQDNFLAWSEKDFEPTHTMLMFKEIALRGIPYGWGDLLRGLPAVLPFSSYIDIDPHIFSEVVKHRFFSSWGADAGVGANFWAQGYALFGLGGVILFAGLVLLSLLWLERAIARAPSSAVRATLTALGAIIAFYVHRNSLEQILSFVGRYATIGVFFAVATRILWNSTKPRRAAFNLGPAPLGAVRQPTRVSPGAEEMEPHG